jgi:hydroxymethylbilane synthase
MLPAPSQGAIGVEVTAERGDVRAWIAAIGHGPTHAAVMAERRLLEALGGDCRSAVAAYAYPDGGEVWLRAELLAPDGSEVQRGEARFAADERGVAAELAAQLLANASPALRGMFGQ